MKHLVTAIFCLLSSSLAQSMERSFCEAIPPSPNPTSNYTNISTCLNTYNNATLQSGVFPLETGITVRGGQSLNGNTTYPVLKRVGPVGPNFLVKISGRGAVVSFLTLDGNSRVHHVNGAIVSFEGDAVESFIHDTNITDTQTPENPGVTGIYFFDGGSANLALRTTITNTFHGVIFSSSDTSRVNTVESASISSTLCDSVSFPGYGVLKNSKIFEGGWDCANGIPAAGVYSTGNNVGFLVQGVEIVNMCGNGIDIDNSSSFTIENSWVHDPGYRWNGARNFCGGTAVAMIDVRNSKIFNNVFENNRATNVVGIGNDPNQVFRKFNDRPFADLPAGGNTLISVWLGSRPRSPDMTTNNVFSGNQMRASCTAPCVGLGYFTSRRTGVDANGVWSASSTNYFIKNNPFGSNVGSKRCGQNWFAGNSVCTATQTDADCNVDDLQHTLGGFRSDNCNAY